MAECARRFGERHAAVEFGISASLAHAEVVRRCIQAHAPAFADDAAEQLAVVVAQHVEEGRFRRSLLREFFGDLRVQRARLLVGRREDFRPVAPVTEREEEGGARGRPCRAGA